MLFFRCHKHWREKIRNQTCDPQILHSNALPLSHRDYMVTNTCQFSKFMTCAMHTARISNVQKVMFVNTIGEMISFQFPSLLFHLQRKTCGKHQLRHGGQGYSKQNCEHFTDVTFSGFFKDFFSTEHTQVSNQLFNTN